MVVGGEAGEEGREEKWAPRGRKDGREEGRWRRRGREGRRMAMIAGWEEESILQQWVVDWFLFISFLIVNLVPPLANVQPILQSSIAINIINSIPG